MTKTKTIPLEVPEEWEFERAVAMQPIWQWMTPQYQKHQTSCYVKLISAEKPSWSWCESPTDEMALVRPDCEVWSCDDKNWEEERNILIAVLSQAKHSKYKVAQPNYGFTTDGFDRCRVRIDNATGRVIERWE